MSGPASATVQNGDRAVATVSDLQEGTYKFQLTVADAEGLTGRDVLTVTVKRGKVARN